MKNIYRNSLVSNLIYQFPENIIWLRNKKNINYTLRVMHCTAYCYVNYVKYVLDWQKLENWKHQNYKGSTKLVN